MSVELTYQRGSRSASEIQEDIDRIWASLWSDAEVMSDAKELDIDLNSLQRSAEPPKVRVSGAGIDPITVALIVAFSPAVNEIAISVWKELILPRIRARHGRNAIGPAKDKQ